jgi:hypothetical protein
MTGRGSNRRKTEIVLRIHLDKSNATVGWQLGGSLGFRVS